MGGPTQQQARHTYLEGRVVEVRVKTFASMNGHGSCEKSNIARHIGMRDMKEEAAVRVTYGIAVSSILWRPRRHNFRVAKVVGLRVKGKSISYKCTMNGKSIKQTNVNVKYISWWEEYSTMDRKAKNNKVKIGRVFITRKRGVGNAL